MTATATRDLANVPRSALTFDAGAGSCKFQQANDAGNYPVRLLARSGQPIEHWWWGRVVHDLAGMFIPGGDGETIPLDWCHDVDMALGFGRPEVVAETDGDNLYIAGELTPFTAEDRPTEVAHKGQRGVPYQASIDFYGDGIQVEELGQGQVAEVNGYQLEGPATIVRRWPLRGVAICLYGADQNTGSMFSGDADQSVAVSLLQKEDAMTKETKHDDDQVAKLSKEDLIAQAAEMGLSVSDDAKGEFAAELARFVAAFGAENGAKWFTDGKTFEDALALHCDALAGQLQQQQADIAKLTQERDDAIAKLASVDRGESEPLDDAGDKGKSDKGKNFIRMPGTAAAAAN